MCGIAGFFGPPNQRVLERMVDVLEHRGPDDLGSWTCADVSLGMRRLSIVDLETGQQPVTNEDGAVVSVFNGEIYNHVELRKDLQAKGHVFRSHHADSEVIVHLYEEYGIDFPQHLNGMFAIALFDRRRGELMLIRDRVGIKPLYYAMPTGQIVFGSEPKAVLIHPQISRDPDLTALHHYFSLKNIPSPQSAFKDIKQLRPGEMLVYDGARMDVRRWWNLSFDEDFNIDEQEAASEIRRLLVDSVGLNMRTDVPFGAYLSGGVDSSAVVAIASQILDTPLMTFTLVYDQGLTENKDADRHFAKLMSEKYGTEHHEQHVRHHDVPELIDRVLGSFDEPYSGVISTFFLTELIKKHVKVTLSGDGADELFGSYAAHRMALPLQILRKSGGKMENVPDEYRGVMAEFAEDPSRIESFVARGDSAAARMGLYLSDEHLKAGLYTDEMTQHVGDTSTEAQISTWLDEAGTDDALNQALYLDIETLLADQVLPFVDRLSMAHSVEVRPPFLDHRLVEFTARLPGSMKIKNGRVKHILKEAVGDLLCDGLVDRPKEGFLMPVNEWMFNNLRPYVEDVLSPSRLAKHGLLRADVVSNLVDSLYAGNHRAGDRVWNIMMFQLWWEKYTA
jgi:asparagine synthase (glutamine-hydrolysing)